MSHRHQREDLVTPKLYEAVEVASGAVETTAIEAEDVLVGAVVAAAEGMAAAMLKPEGATRDQLI